MMGGGKHGASPVASKPNILHTLRIQTSAFGQCIPIIYGTQRREMRLLWAGDFAAIPHTSTQSTGGKGGGGSQTTTTTTYSYQTALEAALCEGPISAIRNMWDEKGHSFLSRTTASFTVPGPGGTFTATPPAGNIYLDDLGVTRNDSFSVAGVNDYGSDGAVTLSGTQKTPMVKVIGAPGAGQYSLSGNVYTFATADAGKVMKITYTYGKTNTSGLSQPLDVYNLTLLKGARPQTAWSYLTSRHAGQDLGYNGIALVVSPAFDLGFSNNMRNLNFEVAAVLVYGNGIEDAEPSAAISDIIANTFYGLSGAVTLGSLTQFRNWCIANGLFISPFIDTQVACSDFIQEILDICNSVAVWSENQLKIIPYGDTSIVGNGATYIAANNPIYDITMQDLLSEVKISRKDPADPQETVNSVSIEWLNRLNDYNPEPAPGKDDAMIARFGLIEGSPIAHHAITTKEVAKLAANWELRRQVEILATHEFDLGIQFGLCECADLLTLPLGDLGLGSNKKPVRITSIKEDENGRYSFTCEDFPWGSAGNTLYPHQDASGFSPQDKADPGPVNTPVIFEPPFRLCKGANGNEIWIGAASSNPDWGGANVWYSPDGTTYKKIGTVTAPARMGVIDTGGLASALDPDTANNCPVDLTSSLALLGTGQQGDADNYRTMCYIGGAHPEFISYQTATLVSANKYNLSYLRRGLGGTNPGAHLLNDPFLRLDESVWVWPYDPAIIGKSGFFKFTSFNTLGNMEQSLASATAYAYTVKGTAAVSGTEALDELIHTGTSDGTAGAKSIHRFSTTTYAIVSGDELHYDVFFDPTSPSAAGGIDFEYGAGHSLFSAAAINDQNGKSALVPTDANALGQWYHRKFVLTSIAGNTINGWASSLTGVTAGKYKVAYANVKIMNAGVLKATIFGVSLAALTSVPVWAFGSESHYTGVLVYSVHNYPKNFDPSTDQLGSGGSVPPSFNGSFAFTNTTSSINLTWTGLIVVRDDGSVFPIPDGSQSITGLAAGTTYYVFPYFDEPTQSLLFASPTTTATPVGTPAILYTTKDRSAAAFVAQKNHVPLSTSSSVQVATAAAGTGGGTGGGDGSCLRSTMKVRSQTRGIITLDDAFTGELILDRQGKWKRITFKRTMGCEVFLRIDTDMAGAIEAAPSHPFTVIGEHIPDEVLRRAQHLCMTDTMFWLNGLCWPQSIRKITVPGGKKVTIGVENEDGSEGDHTYLAGEFDALISSHNMNPGS